MKGDFTRNTYQKGKHFSRVLMQQGRVQVDADWNEQLEIDAHIDRTARRDIIGHCGGPQGEAPDGTPLAGFEITPKGGDLVISAGRYYVDGILVENEAEQMFTAQVDYRQAKLPTNPGNYLIYLDVWEHHLTALEEPSIREVALGGPDTATRSRVMGQVKWQDISAEGACSDFGPGWVPNGADSTGRLAARAEPDPPGAKPCIVPEEAGYRRLENQLYRVEIHAEGTLGKATFKWSRENGSVVTRWLSQDGDNLTVTSSGRDEVLGFANQQWVELTDEIHEQWGTPGTLVMIDNVDGDIITIDPTTASGTTTLTDFDAATAKIRRWDSNGALSVTVPTTNNGWIALEDGVQIKFQAGNFRTGDYWLIPARTLTHDIEWDIQAGTGAEGFQLRHGIHHHYCPLAIGPFDGKSWGTLIPCRKLFPPLTEIDRGASCCTVTVGDGVTSVGDFTDIQEALDSLKDYGRVCILAGVYQLKAPVKIKGMEVTISGCGRQTAILGPGEQPAFVIENSHVEMLALAIRAYSSTGAVVANETPLLTIKECLILNLGLEEQKKAYAKYSDSFTHRTESRRVIDRAQAGKYLQLGGPAIVAAASEQVTIAENLLIGTPAIVGQITLGQVEKNQILGGGIWITDGSADVSLESNTISRGAGAGIILGGMPPKLKLSDKDTGVVSVNIFDNTITGMQDSGITSVADVEQDTDLGELEDIHIRQNRIRHCALGGPNPVFDPIAAGGIVLRSVSGLYVRDNLIANNGSENAPACGIFTFFCLGMQVTDNYIAENGSSVEQSDKETVQAYQAGIAALYVVGGEISDNNFSGQSTFQSAGPAALINDNVVICPSGQALIVGAYGPVMVSGNTLTSQGARQQPKVGSNDAISPLAVLGQSVFIFNLAKTPGLGNASAGIAGMVAIHTNATTKNATTAAAESALPDGRTLFHGNQVTLEILENAPPFVISCATVVSFDDVSIQDNQVLTRMAEGGVLASVLAIGVTVRALSNRFHELPMRAFYSYVSQGYMNYATGNQATHCILVKGTQVVSNNQVAITTLCERLSQGLETGKVPSAELKVGYGKFAVQSADILKKL